MAGSNLREFVIAHTTLRQQQQQVTQHNKASRAARDNLASIILEQSEDDSGDAPIVAHIGDVEGKPRFLAVNPNPPPRVCLSEKALLKLVDSLQPGAFAPYIAALQQGAMVPVRALIKDAVLGQLTQPAKSSQVKLLKRAPKGVRVLDLQHGLDEEQQQWVQQCLTAAPSLTPLRRKAQELAKGVQQELPAAAAPNFQQPLVLNVSADEQRRMLLHAAPRVKKPAITKARFEQFFQSMKNDRLEQLVSATSADPGALCDLCKRLLPALVCAMKEWQAQHAETSVDLKLKDIKPQ